MLEFEQTVAPIPGWLTENEGKFLYKYAKGVSPPNIVVEIGSWKGRSTICLGKGVKDGNKASVYAIDPHIGSKDHQAYNQSRSTFQEFKQNIKNAGINEYIEPIVKKSKDARGDVDGTIGLLFIDGDHDYEAVKLDNKLWFPLVADGGVVAFHDARGLLGPHLFTAKLLLFSSRINKPKLIDTLNYFTKVRINSFYDRANNITFLLYRPLFGVAGKIKQRNKGFVID